MLTVQPDINLWSDITKILSPHGEKQLHLLYSGQLPLSNEMYGAMMRGSLKQRLINVGRFYFKTHQGGYDSVVTRRGFSVCNVEFETPKIASAPFVLQPRVVIYDGVCHLCNNGVQWVIKADKHKKIKFCAVQSKAAEPYLIACGLDQKDVLRRFLFVEGPGLSHQASTAALKVSSYLPLPYSIPSIFLLIPTPLRDAVYDYVAKHRYDWFGRSMECIVPDNEVLDRFIDRDEMLKRQKIKF